MLQKETKRSQRSISWRGRVFVATLLLSAGGLLAGLRCPSGSMAIAAPPERPTAAATDSDDIRAILESGDPKLQIEKLQADLKKIEAYIVANPERVTPDIQKARQYLQQRLRDTASYLSRHPEQYGVKILPVRKESAKEVNTGKENAASHVAGLRQQSMNKLRGIGLAMHVYRESHGHFPAAVEMGPDGKTPHSWRVSILPYLEGKGEELSKRYRLGEPWDSENNLKVMKDGVDLFSVPTAEPSDKCGYFALVGPGSIFFPVDVPTTIRDITDGSSKTIALVEAKRDIPWTKPEDIEFEADKPLPKLGGYFDGGYNVFFCDGHMRFMPADVKDAFLRKLVTKAGREPWDYSEIASQTAHAEARQVNTNPPNPLSQSPSLRQQSMNKLKMIGLALQGYHDANKHFPLAVEMGPDGKTPHSWRVALLPYFEGEEAALYKKYRLDEPWDSENNKKVIAEGASLYSVPTDPPSDNCGYFVLTGPGTVFDPKAPASTVRSIIDGTSMTIGVVEAKREMPWTKPEDIPYLTDGPLPKLGGFFEGGFDCVFMDGAAHFIPADLDEPVLRALLSKGGMEILSIDRSSGRIKLGY